MPSRDAVVPFALRQLRTGPALAAHTAIQVEELALVLRAYVGPSQHCLQVALAALGPALADASSPRLAAGAARCVLVHCPWRSERGRSPQSRLRAAVCRPAARAAAALAVALARYSSRPHTPAWWRGTSPAGAARGDEAVTPSYAALLPFISAALQSGVASAATLQLSLSLIETAGVLSGPDKASLGAAVGAWSAAHDPTRLARARAAAAQVAVALGSRSIVCEAACTPPRKPSSRAPLIPLSGNSRAVAMTSRCAGLRTPDGGGPSPRGGHNQCTSPLAALPRLHSSLALMRPVSSRVSDGEGHVIDSRLEGGDGQSRGCLQVTGALTEVERALKWIIALVAGILGACDGAHTPGRASPEAVGADPRPQNTATVA